MTVGHRVGKIYAEIDLDYTPYTRAQKWLYKDATTTTLNIEKAYKNLGIRSAREFDLMRAKAHNSYQRIAKDARTSADDIVRAERAKAKQLKRINEEQFGRQLSLIEMARKHWIALATSIASVTYASKEVYKAGMQMEQLERAYLEITRSSRAANKEFSFLRDVSSDLGQNFYELAGVYKSFLAASKGTNMEGAETERLFRAIAQASASLGLSSENTRGTLYAVQQMMSKGIVSAEELRQQLGERLPGAFNIMAEALGVSIEELDKMLKLGQVMSSDALPKFARTLESKYTRSVADSVRAVNKLNEAWMDFKVSISDAGFLYVASNALSAFASSLSAVGRAFQKMTTIEAIRAEIAGLENRLELADKYSSGGNRSDAFKKRQNEIRERIGVLRARLSDEIWLDRQARINTPDKKKPTVYKTPYTEMDAHVQAYYNRYQERKTELGIVGAEAGHVANAQMAAQSADFVKKARAEYEGMMVGATDSFMGMAAANERALEMMESDTVDASEKMKDAFSGWAVSYSATLTDMFWESEFSFNKILESFGRMLTQMTIQMQMSNIAKWFNEMSMSDIAKGFKKMLNPTPTITSSTPVISGLQLVGLGGKASGGPVYAGGTYVVGERGPELLHMGSNGSITPNHAIVSSQPSFNLNIQNQSGVAVEESDVEVIQPRPGQYMVNMVLKETANNRYAKQALRL